MSDLIFAFAVAGLLMLVALCMIWLQPRSAVYIASLLLRRASALSAARDVYWEVWNQKPQEENQKIPIELYEIQE